MLKTIFLNFLWLFLLAANIQAQEPPVIAMHRSGAGQRDESGWMDAKSTEGKYSVRLPVVFNDFTMRDPSPQSIIDRLFVIGALSAEGIKFAVTRTLYRDPTDADPFFKKWKAGNVLRGKEESRKVSDYQGFESVDVTGSNETALYRGKVILVKGDLFLLMIEAPLSQRELVEKLAPTFFSSLSFEP
jgi:hypothetical protein